MSKDILQHAHIYDHATCVYYFWGNCVSNPRKYVRHAGVRPLLIGPSPGCGLVHALKVTYACAFLIGGQAGAGLRTHGCVISDWSLTDQ